MTVVAICIVVALLLVAQKKIYQRFWKSNLSVKMHFSDKTATEGGALTLYEVVSNAKILPLPWVAVKFQTSKHLVFHDRQNYQISDDYYHNDLFSVLMFQRITRRLPFTCAKRGYYTIKSLDIVSGNILMDVKLADHVECDASICVYPALVPLDALDSAHTRMTGQILKKRFILPDPFEFKGIREYQPYDSFRSINFTATAKTGDLMVNVNDYTITRDVTLMLNLQRHYTWLNDNLDEQSIRLAASLAEYFVSEGIPVRFVTNGADVITGQTADLKSGSGAGHLESIYDTLARIDLLNEPGTFSETFTEIAKAGKTETEYVLVSTYHRKDLTDAFAELAGTGAGALWVLPYTPDIEVKLPENMGAEVVKWEAESVDKQAAVGGGIAV